MPPEHPRPGPRGAGPELVIADPAWRRVPRIERLVRRVCGAAEVVVVLDSDRAVRRLNARHRGRDKPTNVLTFPASPSAETPGEIVLAAGVVAREAAAEGKRVAHHTAHLLLHGLLHLDGHDHHGAGEARRMEMAETRALARLGVPNPWKARRAMPGVS
jgi:probable rRNA maturation factor